MKPKASGLCIPHGHTPLCLNLYENANEHFRDKVWGSDLEKQNA